MRIILEGTIAVRNVAMRTIVCLSVSSVLCLGSPRVTDAGALDPAVPPAPTMRTLTEINERTSRLPAWDQDLDSTNGSSAAGRVGCDSDRFHCIWNDQAVVDRATGLIWLCARPRTTEWRSAPFGSRGERVA